jgi:octaprenyl-diphosphate synthase
MQSQTPINKLCHILSQDIALLDNVMTSSMKSEVPLVEQIADHILRTGGKRIRPLMTLTACRALHMTQDETIALPADAYALAAAVELIHSATLLHDDVIDMSDLRRGQPAAHTQFGNTATILTGDYMFARSFQLMVSCKTPHVLAVLSTVASSITEGEVLQLSHSFDFDLSLKTYLDIIRLKTATLFEASAQVGAMVGLYANAPLPSSDMLIPQQQPMVNAFARYGQNLGMAFQMIDDIYDYFPPEAFGKNIGDDLWEGKVTLPIIFLRDAMIKANDPELLWLKELFSNQKNNGLADAGQKTQIMNKMRQKFNQYNVSVSCFELVDEYSKVAIEALEQVPLSNLTYLLSELVQYLQVRHTLKQAS